VLEFTRLVTVHPALVHVPLGGVVFVAFMYAMGKVRGSDRWTFAGDATLWLTTAWTLATATFGVISNFVLDWPGGLGGWRWLHAGLGLATTLLLLALSWSRMRHDAPQVAGKVLVGGSVLTMVVALFTGWVGGEVLVFHGGIAVQAAGQGALAPPTGITAPRDLDGAMSRLRSHWAAAQVEAASMIVEHPSSEAFASIGLHADRLGYLARWLHDTPIPGEDEDGRAEREDHASEISASAGLLYDAARAEDLTGVVDALGDMAHTCADCHQELRWPAPDAGT
jgi:uncharacterized membrane protein